MAEAFEQQPKESAKAFAAFTEYLNLGPERSLAAVARKLSKSEPLVKRWSARFDWPARVAAHAAHLAAVEREAAEAAARSKALDWAKVREAQRLEEYQMHEEALALARAAIARWNANERRCGSLEGIARLLELASRLGRLASGMATDRTEITGEDGGPIRVEFEAALKKIYGDPLVVKVVDVESVGEAPTQARELRALPDKAP